MLLAIDVGNTNTVFAVFQHGKIVGQWRAATVASRTADEYAVWLGQLMTGAGFELADVEEAIVATVVPQGLMAIQGLCERYCGCSPFVVGDPKVTLGIEVRMPHPGEVGADRLVNTVGAHVRYPGALIVLDFGTATTFDVVAADGAYEGGIIAPGINLSLEALHQAAAQLPRIAVERPAKVVGDGTVSGMQSGIYWGYLGLIEGIVTRIKAERNEPMTTIATGGLAPLFSDGTDIIEHVDQDLTIRGLLEINKLNARTTA